MKSIEELKLEHLEGLKQIEKVLQVLEIINKKNVCVELFKDCSNAEEYNDICGYHHSHCNSNYKVQSLTDEEFGILKEVVRK